MTHEKLTLAIQSSTGAKINRSELFREFGTQFLVFSGFVVFTFYAFRNYMVGGIVGQDYIWGGDGMAHVYKVTELVARMKEGAYVDWTDAWYLGYHPFHFYTPLSYAIYAFAGYLVGDVGVGIRIGIATSFLASLIGMYLVAFEITGHFRFRRVYKYILSVVVAIYYAYHPYLVSFITFVSDLPAAYSFSFLPVSFLFYLRSLRYGGMKNCAGCSIFLAATFLSHPYTGAFAAGAIGLHYVLGLLFTESRSRHNLLTKFPSLLGITLLFLGLVASWIIPYYYESDYLAQIAGYEWTIPITSVKLASFFDPSAKSGWTASYLGISAILILILGFINRQRLKENLTYGLMFGIAVYLALGIYAPLSFLNPLIPLGVYPERALVLCVFYLGCGLASAGGSLVEKTGHLNPSSKVGSFTTWLVIGLTLLTIIDSSSISPSISLSSPVPSFNDVSQFVQQQGLGDGRVLFIGPDAPLYSYSPALTGRNLAGGYYLQGSKLAYWTEHIKSFSLARNETAKVLNRYDEFNVEYIVVDKRSLDLIGPLLTLKVLDNVYENERYIVYKYLRHKGIIQPAPGDVFVVGERYPSSVVKSVLEQGNPNITVTTSDSPFIDDYGLDELLSREALILYSFTYHDKENAESLLRAYVEQGKSLVVDMDGFHLSWVDVAQGDFLGVRFTQELILDGPEGNSWGGPLDVTYSALNINNSLSKAVYPQDLPWHAMIYDGFTEILLEVNGLYNAVGVRENVTFVGLNLFYHALLYDNFAEMEVLRQISIPKEVARNREFAYQVVKDTPSEKVYGVSTREPVGVLVSIAWSPHLWVTVNGEPLMVAVQDGLIRLQLPMGDNTIRITYIETSVHVASEGVTIGAIVLLMILMVRARLQGKKSLKQTDTC